MAGEVKWPPMPTLTILMTLVFYLLVHADVHWVAVLLADAILYSAIYRVLNLKINS